MGLPRHTCFQSNFIVNARMKGKIREQLHRGKEQHHKENAQLLIIRVGSGLKYPGPARPGPVNAPDPTRPGPVPTLLIKNQSFDLKIFGNNWKKT